MTDCMPLGSLYFYLKNSIAGINENDLEGLYRCTLCNHCRLADLNLGVRNAAVSKGLVAPHLARIKGSIREYGNPYGIAASRGNGAAGKTDTVLFRGCTPTYKTPEILAAAERLLQGRGIEYGIMDDETCCGSILFNLGDRESGLEAVRKNVEKFKAAGVKRIITICPGCYEAFNKYYRGQEGFGAEVVLAIDLIKGMQIEADGYAVQDPCHAKEKANTVRSLLKGVRNESASPCCGAGAGLIAHDRPLATLKARKAADHGINKTVTYCPFCYMSLSSARPGKVIDLYVLLDGKKAYH